MIKLGRVSPTRDELLTDTLRTVCEDFPGARPMSTDDLAKLLKNRPEITILDTREPQEFEVSHIHGAVLTQNATDAIELLEDQESDSRIVAYCSVGYRSTRITAILNQRGYSNEFGLERSIFKWANENRPISRGDYRASKVHPYDENQGRLLKPEILP